MVPAVPCGRAQVRAVVGGEFASTVFIKVDVDKARDVATSQAIQAMPTFKFYKDNACIETIQGFNEQKIAAALGKLGKKEK